MAVPDASAPTALSRWELPLQVTVLLALNLSAGVAAKLLAVRFGDLGPCLVLAAVMTGCYVGRLWVWLRLGRRWQLSFVYPLLSLNYPLAGLLGYLLFGETASALRAAGLGLIAAGVVLVARSPNRADAASGKGFSGAAASR